MIKNSVSIQEVIEFLNELVEMDQEAVNNLVEQRIECNKKLADHPTVQVTAYDCETPKVGILGVLNGLFGANEEGWGPIAAVFDEYKLVKFQRTKQTVLTCVHCGFEGDSRFFKQQDTNPLCIDYVVCQNRASKDETEGLSWDSPGYEAPRHITEEDE